MLLASNGAEYNKLKCLENRYVIELRPYDGGPIAPTKVISIRNLNSLVSKSYHPPVSIHYLNSSIGGYAPYCSLIGMLRSSMKIIIYFF